MLSRGFWLALILGGVAARLGLWWISIGSNDAMTWYQFGSTIGTDGLDATYEKLPFFNHPPLMGLYAMRAWQWCGDDLWTFTHLFKLAGLAGEGLTLWALGQFAGLRAAAIYAWLPAAILVSGYHCNTDTLCAALVLVSVIAFDRQLYFLAGVLLAATLNVKLIPLMLLPLVFIGLPTWNALRLLTGGLAIGATPFLVPALTVGPAMYRNMLLYNSNADNWGIPLFLRFCSRMLAPEVFGANVLDTYLTAGRYIILAVITIVALLSRFRSRRSMAEQAALGSALFLLLTPGFGVQYVVLVAPLLCLVDIPAAIGWGCVSGLFLALVYWHFLVPEAHFISLQTGDFPVQAWVIGVAAWAILLNFVWRHRPFGDAQMQRQARPGLLLVRCGVGIRRLFAHGERLPAWKE